MYIKGIVVLLFITVLYFSFNLQNFKNVMKYDYKYIPDITYLNKISANNVLTYTGNDDCLKTNDSDIYNTNKDCQENYQYQKNMSLRRRVHDTSQHCNSIVNIIPHSQNKYNPKNFSDF